jgi:hypothetical protein
MLGKEGGGFGGVATILRNFDALKERTFYRILVERLYNQVFDISNNYLCQLSTTSMIYQLVNPLEFETR